LPDFDWFVGDEEPTFDSRPSNELMYIREVGNLRPEPCDSYGPYAVYNTDVVDSALICAVRSAYENLIKQLEHSFEVDVVDAFDFVTRDEIDENDSSPYRFPIHRVVTLPQPTALHLRHSLRRCSVPLRGSLPDLPSLASTSIEMLPKTCAMPASKLTLATFAAFGS
jgi:hypothetical protein